MDTTSFLDVCGCEKRQFFARTQDGQLYRQKNSTWQVFDFNQEYRDYYPACTFTKIAYWEETFYLAGADNHGVPHLFCSLLGNVWEPRNICAQHPISGTVPATGRIVQILYSERVLQVFLISDDGQLIVLPDCPKCVRIIEIKPGAIDGFWENEKLIVVFQQEIRQSISIEAAAQFRASMSYMNQRLCYGGILVDVRTNSLCESSPIPNSIHVPLEELHDWLMTLNRTTELYFVCHIGTQADVAVKHARDNGFLRAYSVGGLNAISHID